MVRSARKKARRASAPMRTHMRKLNRAVAEQAVVVRPPADPPSIKTYRTYTICTQFVILSSDSRTDCEYHMPPQDHVINLNLVKATSASYPLSATDLLNAWLYSNGHKDNSQAGRFEVAIVKASFWGPMPQQAAASITLGVNSGASQRVIVDHGSPMSRPRCGISIPKLTWGGANQSVRVGITTSTKGDLKKDSIIGIVQVTMSGRMKGDF